MIIKFRSEFIAKEIKMPNTYLTFMQANEALAKCMSGVKPEQYQAMSAADQGNVCKSEANTVRDLLQNDSVSFRNLLNERIAAAKAQQQ